MSNAVGQTWAELISHDSCTPLHAVFTVIVKFWVQRYEFCLKYEHSGYVYTYTVKCYVNNKCAIIYSYLFTTYIHEFKRYDYITSKFSNDIHDLNTLNQRTIVLYPCSNYPPYSTVHKSPSSRPLNHLW